MPDSKPHAHSSHARNESGQLVRQVELVERDAWLDFFAAAPDETKQSLRLSHEVIEGIGLLSCPAIPIVELNRGMVAAVDHLPSSSAVMHALEWLRSRAAPGWAMQVAPLSDGKARAIPGLGNLIECGGWTKFAQRLLPGMNWSPATDAHVSEVKDASASSFGSLVQGGFGLPEECATWFGALVGRPGWHCFEATVENEPAGAAAMFVSGTAAWCGMSATLPSFRGRGVQTGLIAARLEAASRLGVSIATCETGNPPSSNAEGYSSYRNQKRAGFTELFIRTNLKASC